MVMHAEQKMELVFSQITLSVCHHWTKTQSGTFSQETAHSTVYHHLSQQSSCITTAHWGEDRQWGEQKIFGNFAIFGRFAKISCREYWSICRKSSKQIEIREPPDATNLWNFPVLQYQLFEFRPHCSHYSPIASCHIGVGCSGTRTPSWDGL